jgi:hypothetical protein
MPAQSALKMGGDVGWIQFALITISVNPTDFDDSSSLEIIPSKLVHAGSVPWHITFGLCNVS